MKNGLTAILMIAATTVFAQPNIPNSRHNYQFGNSIQTVKEADNITFYGYDVSRYKVTVKKRELSDFNLCDKLASDLQFWMNDKFSSRKIRRKFKFRHLDYDASSIQAVNNNKGCLTNDRYELTKGDVASQVKDYKLPDEPGEGVGFVIIPENLNKKAGYASAFLVFFDIDSRKILFGGHVSSKHFKGKTMRAYFGSALWRCVKRFKRTIYKHPHSNSQEGLIR